MKIFTTSIFCILTSLGFGQAFIPPFIVCQNVDLDMVPLDNLNTGSIEFSPAYYQQGLVYVVAREKSNFLDPKTGRAYFDLMYTDIGPDGEASKSVPFSPNIRTQYHEGPCSFSIDGQEMFFTRSNLSGGQGIKDEKGLVQLKIYSALKGEEDWEQITEMPFCNNESAFAHPTISIDGGTLIFSSDMPGGYGGMDLYSVSRENGVWSTPMNLGSSINTKGNELFPFLHAEGYLFFSTDGRKGFGGLDIFVSNLDSTNSYSLPEQLDTPFNTAKDDLGLIVSPDGKSGYMASDRKPTKGKDDLYRWTSPYTIFCNPPGKKYLNLSTKEILVTNEINEPMDQSYFWIIPMSQEGPTQYKDHFTTELVPKDDKDGAFYLRWSVTDTLTKESANAISDQEGKVSLEANEKVTYVLVARHEGYLPYTEVLLGSQIPTSIVLKKAKMNDPSCLRTLYTIYNENGETPLNGAKIKLSGSCLKDPIVFYTDESGGGMKCLPKGCSIKADIDQVGYAPHAFTFTPEEDDEHWKIYLKSSDKLTAPPSPIASGTMIVLDNIYYDFNKSVIRKGDAGELIALADILKNYPDLTIELTSHTDTRGSAAYNMELSEKRSASSKSYLVLLGIDPTRIMTKAAGESSPRNKCLDEVPCTELEHQYNRRTEVRIINPAEGMQIRYKAEG